MPSHRTQQCLFTSTHTNIDPSGDTLTPRTDSDGYIRIAYQNIHGTRSLGLQLPTEIDASTSWGCQKPTAHGPPKRKRNTIT